MSRVKRSPGRVWLLAALALLIAAATWLRFYRISEQPAGLLEDEIWQALNARQLDEGVTACCPLYFIRPFGGHPLFVYFTWLAQALGAPPPVSGRIVIASLGVSSVLIAFFAFRSLARSLGDEQEAAIVGLAGAAVLATTFAHVTFSRLGLETLLAGALGLPILWLLWLAFEKGSYRVAAACGVVIGLSLYSYAPAAAFVLVGPVYASWRWLNSSRSERGRIVKLTVLLLICIALTAAPLVFTLANAPDSYLAHLLGTTEDKRSGGPVAIALRLAADAGRLLLGISVSGDRSEEYGLLGRPLFDPGVSVFFWLGAAVVCAGAARRRPACQLAVVWAVCASLPAWLSDDVPHFGRWLQVLPALAFSVGVGVLWLWRFAGRLGQSRPRLAHGVAGVVLAGAGLFSLYLTAVGYFGARHTQAAYRPAPRLAAQQAASLALHGTVFVSPTGDNLLQPIFDLLLRDTPVRQIDGRACLPLAWEATAPTVYAVFTLADSVSLPRLRTLYPSGRIVAEVPDSPNPWPYALFFEVPAGVRPEVSMLEAPVDFSGGIRLIGYSLPRTEVRPGRELKMDLYWEAAAPPTEELVAFVHIGRPGELLPLAQEDRAPCNAAFPTTRWSPGEVYLDHRQISLAKNLPAGSYEVRIGLYSWPDQRRQIILRTDLPVILQQNIVKLADIRIEAP